MAARDLDKYPAVSTWICKAMYARDPNKYSSMIDKVMQSYICQIP